MKIDTTFPISNKIAHKFVLSLASLSDEERDQLINECKNFNTGNCWFVSYELRGLMSRLSNDINEAKKD